MKMNKTLMSRRSVIKAMSSFLSLVLTANAGLSLLTENVFAADGYITYSGNTVTTTSSLNDNGSEDFYLVDLNGGIKVSKSRTTEENAVSISQNCNFVINKCCTLSQHTDYTFGNIQLQGGSATLASATLKINSGTTVTIKGSISGTGNNEILNYATCKVNEFNASYLESYGVKAFNNGKAWPSGKGVYGTGILEANNVYIGSSIYQDVEGSSIKVSNIFQKDNMDINAVVIAKPTTTIISTGGTFTLQVGNVTKEITGAVNGTAFEVLGSPKVLVYDNTVYLYTDIENNGFEVFYLRNSNGNLVISQSRDNDSDAVVINDGCNFDIKNCCLLDVFTNYHFGHVHLEGGISNGISYATFNVGSGYSVTINGRFSGNQSTKITNNGTINISEFYESDLKAGGINIFDNRGMISTDVVYLDSDIYTDTSDSEIFAHKRVFVTNKDVNAKISVEPNTSIYAENSSFLLGLFSAEKFVDRDVLNGSYTHAEDLFDDPDIMLFSIPDVIYGTDYDFSDRVSTDPGYDRSKVYLQYSKDGSSTLDYKPEAPGSYYVRAVAPDNGTYLSDETYWQLFNIYYLPLNSLYPSGAPYFTVSGTVNGKYIPEDLVLTAPDGILIGCPALPGFKNYSTSVTLTEDDLCIDGHINESLEIVFVRTSDGATTDGIAISSLISGIGEYVFDHSDPHFDAYIVDSEGGLRETSIDEEGAVIVADELKISVSDANLKSVILNVDGTETDLSDKIENGLCDITLYGAVAKTKSVTITAKDYADRVSKTQFTLYHEPVDPELKVTLPDVIYVGDDYTPEIITNSDGKITVDYSNADGSLESTEPFKYAGTYRLYVTTAATAFYNAASYETEYTILKRTPSATVSAADIFVGGTVKPVVTSTSDGKASASFEYKVSGAPDTSYSSEAPTAAGRYTVRATIPATDRYLTITCTSDFTIKKFDVPATVSAEDIFVNGTVKPVVSTESDGVPAFEYKLSTAPDTAYSSEAPSAAGTYTVRATIPETDSYLAITCTSDFTIKKFAVEAEVSVEDIFVGGTVAPVVTTESNGKNSAAFEYKLSTDPESEYSSAVPSAAGTYSVRARIPETDEYESITCTSEFTIKLNKVTLMELTIKDFYVGQTVDIEYKSNSDGKMSVMYKRSDAPNSAYTSVAPTDPGKYTARATVPATDIYESASCTTEFSITYLEAPQPAYIPTGKEGNNDYFTSDVTLKAPDGYKISATYGENYAPSIPYTEGLEKIYLKRDDGALTAAITITNKPKIDKSAPTLTSSTGDLNEGDVIYAASMDVDVSDLNLTSITVNGEKVDLKSLKGKKLTLSSGMGTADYKITAEDVAGNITTIDFTLKAEWLENKVILPGVALPLAEDESYTLDSGSWTVTMNDADGNIVEDTTVYNGDMPVYVNAGGDYTFTKVN